MDKRKHMFVSTVHWAADRHKQTHTKTWLPTHAHNNKKTDLTNPHFYFEKINEAHHSSAKNLTTGTKLNLPKQNRQNKIFSIIC